MTNPYYTPTGTPAQGAAGASEPIRAEFASIQAGFDKLPSSATPLMNGTAAVGTSNAVSHDDHVHPSDTSRLPTSALSSADPLVNGTAAPGTSSSVARDDHVHPTDSSRQAALGFTPVQQGGGADQGTNKVYVGWDAAGPGLKAQVDTTDLGFFAMQGWVSGNFSALNVKPVGASNATSGTTVSAATGTLTAPSNGYAVVVVLGTVGASLSAITASVTASLGAMTTVWNGGQHAAGLLRMTSGQSSTFTGSVSNSNSGYLGVTVLAFFIPTA